MDFFRIAPKRRTLKLKGRQGVIYSNPGWAGKWLFGSGTVILLAAAGYLIYLYLPLIGDIWRYQAGENLRKNPIRSSFLNSELVRELAERPLPPVKETPEETKIFVLDVPRINAKAKIATGVSAFDREEYNRILQNNFVALAAGSALPGSGKGHSSFIFAHSSGQNLNNVRNNRLFYLLGRMENEDDIFVYQGENKLRYKVYDKKIVGARDTDYVFFADPSREVLILQTCWPIGTNWKRLLVFAEMVE